MRALNPFTGQFYREALQMSRMTREMFCLMEGRHVHPSTLYPGGVGTVPTLQLFTDYLVRLMKYVEFMKKVVPLHDDLFDFFYEALPGYEEVGQRRDPAGLLGLVQRPRGLRLHLPEHERVGQRDVRHARRRRRRQAGHHQPGRHQPRHPHPAGQFVLRRLGRRARCSSKHDPLGNPVDQRHPWNQTTIPKPQKRDFKGKYTWVMSPRWFDKRTGDHLALDTGGGPLARLWATALAGMVDIGYVKATGQSVKIYLPKTALHAEVGVRVEDPASGATPSSATGPGPTSRPTPPRRPSTSSSRRWRNCTPAGPRPGPSSRCPTRPSAAASTRRCAACSRTTS